MKIWIILAVIFFQVLCLLAVDEFDDQKVGLPNISSESRILVRPRGRWIEENLRNPWWIRPRLRRKKNKKVLPKWMQQNQHRRRMHISSNSFGQVADFVSNQRREGKKTVPDSRRIKIRIRLRQRSPVKRHAKQGKKRSKKVLKKLAQKLATQEAMALILKNFLYDYNSGFPSHKTVRKSSKGYQRVGQFALQGSGKGGRRIKVRSKKRKN